MSAAMIFAEKQQFNQAFFIGNEPPIVDHFQNFFLGSPSYNGLEVKQYKVSIHRKTTEQRHFK